MQDAVAMLNAELEKLAMDKEYRRAAFVGHPEGNPVTTGPRVKTPQDWVDDMISGAKARSARWLANSKAPKRNPKEAALAAAGKFENNVKTALAEKRYDAGIKGYDEAARDAVIDAVGTRGFEEGLESHRAKAVSKINKLQPLVTAVALANDKAKVDSLPDRKTKMLNNVDMMIQVGRIMKGVSTGPVTAIK